MRKLSNRYRIIYRREPNDTKEKFKLINRKHNNNAMAKNRESKKNRRKVKQQ